MRVGFIALGAAIALLADTGTTHGQDARTVIATAASTMGANTLKTITLTGSGSVGSLGQNVTPTSPWPLVSLKRYTRTVDLEALGATLETVRIQNGRESSQTQTV